MTDDTPATPTDPAPGDDARAGDPPPDESVGFTPPSPDHLPGTLDLGAFSISLDVADLEVSARFYEALGFVATGGSLEDDYLILKNGESTIGIFHGMFEGNILTFNPGLTNRMQVVEDFVDVRDIQQRLEAAGLELDQRVDPDVRVGTGIDHAGRPRRQPGPDRPVLLSHRLPGTIFSSHPVAGAIRRVRSTGFSRSAATGWPRRDGAARPGSVVRGSHRCPRPR